MAQIEDVVQILANPASPHAQMTQAFAYLERLRSDPEAFQACVSLFVRTPPASETVRVVCLEIINTAVHSRAHDRDTLTYLRDTLLEYVRHTYGVPAEAEPNPAHVRNKLSQTLTCLFVALYQDGWESFVDDFLAIAGPDLENVNGVILYLRILSSVHDEIADLLLSRQRDDLKRNAELKDQVRERDMEKIARSWKAILARYANRNDVVVERVLLVIGKWVSWMDISLVVDQDMLGLLLPVVVGRSSPRGREDRVRNVAINTLNEICGKKMRAADKMEMISFLSLSDIASALLSGPSLGELRNTPGYDTDLAEAVGRLVNTVVCEVVRALEDPQAGADVRARADRHLQEFLPFLLRLFSDEFDEVCSSVVTATTDLVAAIRKMPDRPAAYSGMLHPILNAVITKMRYDETSTWATEDEMTDEAEFQELRKKLQLLQKSLEAADHDLYVDVLSNLVGNTFQTLEQQGARMDWRDLDLALQEMELFGEFALPHQGQQIKKQPSTVATERLSVMMAKMVESDIANFGHPAVVLQYMELCVRYIQFFETHRDYIPRVLENFVLLVHHDHVRVKARSWCLFYRFVRHLRSYVGEVAETVIRSVSDLLPIKAEVPADDADDDMSSDAVDHSADALFQSQLYLYQAVGCMVAHSPTPAEARALCLRSVMDSLFADMELHLPRANAGDPQSLFQIHHIILALGTLAYGFADASKGASAPKPPPPPSSSSSSEKQPGRPAAVAEKPIANEFARAAEAILIALRELNTSSDIRQACRSAFSRLLGVLGTAVLRQLPQWIEGLLSQGSSRDEMAMFLRLLDQVAFSFKGEIYDVLDRLLTPLLQRCFAGLSEPVAGTDDEIQATELRREYLSFLQILLSHGLEGVFVSGRNLPFFESMIASVIGLARTLEAGNATSRLAFGIMTRMVSVWGGPDVATISATPTAPSGPPAPLLPGFDAFLVDQFHGLCWEVMRNPQFRPAADAHSRQLLADIAGLEQAVYLKTGDLFITAIAKLGVDQEEMLRALTTSTDRKAFTAYLSRLLKDRR